MNLAAIPKEMSTREIATLLGKEHRNIRISASRLEKSGTVAVRWSTYDHNGNEYDEGFLNKTDSIILSAQNSPEVTANIVRRWEELEGSSRKELTRLEILTMAIDSERKVLSLEHEKMELQEVARNLTAQFATGLTATEFCKQLNGVNVNKVQRYLVDKGILKHGQGAVSGYLVVSKYRDKYFKQEFQEIGKERRGYAVILPDGAKWLYKKYHKLDLDMKTTWCGNLTHDLYLPTHPSLELGGSV